MKSQPNIWKEFQRKLDDLFSLGLSLPSRFHPPAISKVSEKLQAWQNEVDSNSKDKTDQVKTNTEPRRVSTRNSHLSAEKIKDQGSENEVSETNIKKSPRSKKRDRNSHAIDRAKDDVPESEVQPELSGNLDTVNPAHDADGGTIGDPEMEHDFFPLDPIPDNVVNDTEQQLGMPLTGLKSEPNDYINAEATPVENESDPELENDRPIDTAVPQTMAFLESVVEDVVNNAVEDSPNTNAKKRKVRPKTANHEKSIMKRPKKTVTEPKEKRPLGRPPNTYRSIGVVGEASYKKKFFCDICSRGFATKASYTDHTMIHETGTIECHHCNKQFKSRSGYNNHMKVHEGNGFRCTECPFQTGAKAWLEKHVMQVHRKDDPNSRPYLCDLCGASFGSANILGRHVESHVRDKKYPCPDCDHVTHSLVLLEKHRTNVHTEKDPFVCNICGATCKYKASMLQHQRRHASDKRYKCDECEYACVSSSSLAQHKKCHQAPKEKCPHCAKMFRLPRQLRRHMVIHTGEKEFKCQYCAYSCNVKSNLQKHVKNVHKVKPSRERCKIEIIGEDADATRNLIVQSEKDENEIPAFASDHIVPHNEEEVMVLDLKSPEDISDSHQVMHYVMMDDIVDVQPTQSAQYITIDSDVVHEITL